MVHNPAAFAAKADLLHETYLKRIGFGSSPAQIDRRADQELNLGRHSIAERLSVRAQEMRETAR